jgi:hypothetical protein
MSGEEQLDDTLRERELAGSSAEVLLQGLRLSGVSVDVERLGQAEGLAEVLALAASVVRRAKIRGPSAAGLVQRVLEL